MEVSRIERVCLIAVAMIAGIVLSVVTNSPSWAQSEVAAAWGQAILSVAAIGVSTSLWRADKAKDRQDRVDKEAVADLRAALILTPVLNDACDRLAAVLIEGNGQAFWGNDETLLRIDLQPQLSDLLAPTSNEVVDCSAAFQSHVLTSAAVARQYASHVQQFYGTRIGGDRRMYSVISIDGWAVCKADLEELNLRLLRTRQFIYDAFARAAG